MNKRILAVDDSRTIRTAIAITFATDRGVEVVPIENGRRLIEVLQRGEPVDLILLDYKLPDVDSIALCNKLKEEPSLARIPIFLLVGKSFNPQTFHRADAIVEKPFLTEELRKRVLQRLNVSFIPAPKTLIDKYSAQKEESIEIDVVPGELIDRQPHPPFSGTPLADTAPPPAPGMPLPPTGGIPPSPGISHPPPNSHFSSEPPPPTTPPGSPLGFHPNGQVPAPAAPPPLSNRYTPPPQNSPFVPITSNAPLLQDEEANNPPSSLETVVVKQKDVISPEHLIGDSPPASDEVIIDDLPVDRPPIPPPLEAKNFGGPDPNRGGLNTTSPRGVDPHKTPLPSMAPTPPFEGDTHKTPLPGASRGSLFGGNSLFSGGNAPPPMEPGPPQHPSSPPTSDRAAPYNLLNNKRPAGDNASMEILIGTPLEDGAPSPSPARSPQPPLISSQNGELPLPVESSSQIFGVKGDSSPSPTVAGTPSADIPANYCKISFTQKLGFRESLSLFTFIHFCRQQLEKNLKIPLELTLLNGRNGTNSEFLLGEDERFSRAISAILVSYFSPSNGVSIHNLVDSFLSKFSHLKELKRSTSQVGLFLKPYGLALSWHLQKKGRLPIVHRIIGNFNSTSEKIFEGNGPIFIQIPPNLAEFSSNLSKFMSVIEFSYFLEEEFSLDVRDVISLNEEPEVIYLALLLHFHLRDQLRELGEAITEKYQNSPELLNLVSNL